MDFIDFKKYEKKKRKIMQLNIPPKTYERMIQKIVKELENDTGTKSI